MIRASCWGPVIWVGPWSNPTHTECQDCGRTNNQIVEVQDDEDDNDQEPT